ncbi:MAG TPA: NAD(P)/FAD-dependent oxidoreductase [Chthoniobacterales bacterium]|nr:NAD(P)/FAD-dependent oxidoreductase [Chthoniobacterales bacterium]
MEVVDVAIVGAGPAGSSCAAFCAAAGLRTIVLEREKFPREKVCGDCLNPACWPVLRRLDLFEPVRALPHGRLDCVEFIAISGAKVHVDLPRGEESEIAVKRSLFDELLLTRARELGAAIREQTIVTAIEKTRWGDWRIDIVQDAVRAHALVAADGRNSTVARLRNLLPPPQRERVALQAHIPLPADFGNRVVLQFLPEGYSGQAPVNENELNICLVGRPDSIRRLKAWAEKTFDLAGENNWRTITPLTRAPIQPAYDNLFFIGDAARVVEPFTGEGIYYALRSGELAANAIIGLLRRQDRQSVVREFTRAHAKMYRGRLWINRLARAAVLSPRIASAFVHAARIQPALLRLLARKIVATAL